MSTYYREREHASVIPVPWTDKERRETDMALQRRQFREAAELHRQGGNRAGRASMLKWARYYGNLMRKNPGYTSADLRRGARVEMEHAHHFPHGKKAVMARNIARDHLREGSTYYRRLAKMLRDMKARKNPGSMQMDREWSKAEQARAFGRAMRGAGPRWTGERAKKLLEARRRRRAYFQFVREMPAPNLMVMRRQNPKTSFATKVERDKVTGLSLVYVKTSGQPWAPIYHGKSYQAAMEMARLYTKMHIEGKI